MKVVIKTILLSILIFVTMIIEVRYVVPTDYSFQIFVGILTPFILVLSTIKERNKRILPVSFTINLVIVWTLLTYAWFSCSGIYQGLIAGTLIEKFALIPVVFCLTSWAYYLFVIYKSKKFVSERHP